eukprot:TRINITY_DN1765_c0_g1_i3.p1 TRINITY_DN1765_c0_g1~~TRINITY_DN1765_c0_g1_i3.p1  ORF type:complete len:604 (+),score=75.96 TRINITY_DN1765_c0_g1_i3:193-1812(+)
MATSRGRSPPRAAWTARDPSNPVFDYTAQQRQASGRARSSQRQHSGSLNEADLVTPCSSRSFSPPARQVSGRESPPGLRPQALGCYDYISVAKLRSATHGPNHLGAVYRAHPRSSPIRGARSPPGRTARGPGRLNPDMFDVRRPPAFSGTGGGAPAVRAGALSAPRPRLPLISPADSRPELGARMLRTTSPRRKPASPRRKPPTSPRRMLQPTGDTDRAKSPRRIPADPVVTSSPPSTAALAAAALQLPPPPPQRGDERCPTQRPPAFTRPLSPNPRALSPPPSHSAAAGAALRRSMTQKVRPALLAGARGTFVLREGDIIPTASEPPSGAGGSPGSPGSGRAASPPRRGWRLPATTVSPAPLPPPADRAAPLRRTAAERTPADTPVQQPRRERPPVAPAAASPAEMDQAALRRELSRVRGAIAAGEHPPQAELERLLFALGSVAEAPEAPPASPASEIESVVSDKLRNASPAARPQHSRRGPGGGRPPAAAAAAAGMMAPLLPPPAGSSSPGSHATPPVSAAAGSAHRALHFSAPPSG